jgi:hypothetical protein
MAIHRLIPRRDNGGGVIRKTRDRGSPGLVNQKQHGVAVVACLGYAQNPCKKLQARETWCSEIISCRIFGRIINPTVFFVHDFGHFYRLKPVHSSCVGNGVISGRYVCAVRDKYSNICFDSACIDFLLTL